MVVGNQRGQSRCAGYLQENREGQPANKQGTKNGEGASGVNRVVAEALEKAVTYSRPFFPFYLQATEAAAGICFFPLSLRSYTTVSRIRS